MSIPLILGLLFLIGFIADIVGRSTFLPRVTLLMLGAFGWYLFWIVAGTGIYLYIFFDTGITTHTRS